MGTGALAVTAQDRAKQRRGGHLRKKALLHFSLCFVSWASPWGSPLPPPPPLGRPPPNTRRSGPGTTSPPPALPSTRANLAPSPPDAASAAAAGALCRQGRVRREERRVVLKLDPRHREAVEGGRETGGHRGGRGGAEQRLGGGEGNG
ncbi:unnamed protein product [Urochloa humidicola]